MELTDIGTVRGILARHGLSPKKKYGQNFLVNSSVIRQIAESCGDEGDCILEVGPGIGALTSALADMYKRVLAVEIDRGLIPALAETLSEYENTEVVCADIMKTDAEELICEKFPGEKVRVCANLPYYITSPVIMKLLDTRGILSVTVMIQKEVADRLTASPGTSEYGAITAAVALRASVTKCFDVSPGNFVPPPKVTSTVIRMDIYDKPPVSYKSRKELEAVIRAAFCERRKTLVNALSAGLPAYSKEDIKSAVLSCGFDENIRGERLGISEFARLSDALIARREKGEGAFT